MFSRNAFKQKQTKLNLRALLYHQSHVLPFIVLHVFIIAFLQFLIL